MAGRLSSFLLPHNAQQDIIVYEASGVLFPGVLQQAVPVCANQAAHSFNEPCSIKFIEQGAYGPVTGKVFPESYAACFLFLCPFAGHKPLVDDEAYVGKEHGHG